MPRDLYEVLGVSRSASPDEIRRAHRKLARQLHPDVNKSADAAARFAEVQHAYDVLSDDAQRARYDQFGHAAVSGGSPPQPGRRRTGPMPDIESFDPDELQDFFESVFSGSRGSAGFGRADRRAKTRPRPPLSAEVRVPFSIVLHGGTQSLRLDSARGPSTIEVTIPQGIEDGTQLRVRHAAHGNDILITVRTDPHPLWRRGEGPDSGKGLDLFLELPLTFAEAALGASVRVPTPEGMAEVTVPPGTPSGRRLRLRGGGLRKPQGAPGDLYATVRIIAPSAALTPGEQDALREMCRRGEPLRSGPEWNP
jgi:DnaJ-class molecular chaperone